MAERDSSNIVKLSEQGETENNQQNGTKNIKDTIQNQLTSIVNATITDSYQTQSLSNQGEVLNAEQLSQQLRVRRLSSDQFELQGLSSMDSVSDVSEYSSNSRQIQANSNDLSASSSPPRSPLIMLQENEDIEEVSLDPEFTMDTWKQLQQFVSLTTTFFQSERKELSQLLSDLEEEYKNCVLSCLQFRDSFSRRKDYSLDSTQLQYVSLNNSDLVKQYTLYRVDNHVKLNIGVTREYLSDMLLYLQRAPSLLVTALPYLSQTRDLDQNEFIDNVNNFLFQDILDSPISSRPVFKLLAELVKKEISSARKMVDAFKMDSIYMKFIQGFMKKTSFQIFFAQSFKIPLYSIIKINKILKIDPSKITREDLKLNAKAQNTTSPLGALTDNNSSCVSSVRTSGEAIAQQMNHTSSNGEKTTTGNLPNLNQQSSNNLLESARNSHSNNATNQQPQLRNSGGGFLSGLFNLFSSNSDQRKSRKGSIVGNNINNNNNTTNQDMLSQSAASQASSQGDGDGFLNNTTFLASSGHKSAPGTTNTTIIQGSSQATKVILSDTLSSHDSSRPRKSSYRESAILLKGYATCHTEENSVFFFEESDESLEEEKLREVDRNLNTLKSVTTQLVDCLIKHVICLPKGVKVLCKLIELQCGSLSVNERHGVLSQFLLMRWVIPSLVSLLHRNTLSELHPVRYQNIALIAKLLQRIFKQELEDDQLSQFVGGFSQRIQRFYEYLLNFDDSFVSEIIQKGDSQLFDTSNQSAGALRSLTLSLQDVEILLRIFTAVTDEKVKTEHKKFFAYVEKIAKINGQEKIFDIATKPSNSTILFYVWRPSELFTSSLIDQCLKIALPQEQSTNRADNTKNSTTPVPPTPEQLQQISRTMLLNTVIQFLQKVHPTCDMMERNPDLIAILQFYSRQGRLAQKLLRNGLQLKIQANFILEQLKSEVKTSSGNQSNSAKKEFISDEYLDCLLLQLQSQLLEKRKRVAGKVSELKFTVQQARAKLASAKIQTDKENAEMLERTVKHNVVLFAKKAEVPIKITYQEDCTLLIEKQDDEQVFKEQYALYLESNQIGFQKLRQKMKKKDFGLNENEILCKTVKEFVDAMIERRIFDKMINFFPQSIKAFHKQINFYNDLLVERFFLLPKFATSNRTALYDIVQTAFEKYLCRSLAKRFLLKKPQCFDGTISQETNHRKSSCSSAKDPQMIPITTGIYTDYNELRIASVVPRLQLIERQGNHVDILYLLDECVDYLRDIAELDGLDKNDQLSLLPFMIKLLKKADLADCSILTRVIDCFMNTKSWEKKIKVMESFVLFKHAVCELAND